LTEVFFFEEASLLLLLLSAFYETTTGQSLLSSPLETMTMAKWVMELEPVTKAFGQHERRT